MNKIIILGSGAAPGVPSLSNGWGKCDSYNFKNTRLRSGTYIEYNGIKILIDTSTDLRQQLLSNNIRELDAVLYTHSHADHLNGIDDLREINRIMCKPLDIYAAKDTMGDIHKRFGYLLFNPKKVNLFNHTPRLVPNLIKPNHSFYIKEVKVTPLKLIGHPGTSIGYAFNDGEVVHISDFVSLAMSAEKMITKRPKVMIMPLTTTYGHTHHASLQTLLEYNEKIKPEKLIINHMSTDCDYDKIDSATPDNVLPAYDNMMIEGF